MVDDGTMYGKSGGMYGNPALIGSATDPMQVMSATNQIPLGIGKLSEVFAKGGKMFGLLQSYGAAQKQNEMDYQTLMRERDYNIKNYEQAIADQLASNKISFYASGLDYKTGSARAVIESNRAASTEDMNVMKYNYDMKLKSLKEQRKANEYGLISDMISTVF
jgi:hypothetical protein